MKTTRAERARAEQVSAIIDRWLSDPSAGLGQLDAIESGLAEPARQLAELPALLGPVEPELEARVLRTIGAARPPRAVSRRLRLGWVAAGLVTALLVAVLLTPLGQTAVASLLAVFNLGSTQVRIESASTPSPLPATAVIGEAAIRESLTLAQAQEQVSFPIPQPAYLPPAYRLEGIHSYTYPELPPWIRQPFFLELVYGDASGDELILRVYPIVLGREASISGLDLQATSIQAADNVEVNGQPAVLLQVGTSRGEPVWREVVWEQDDLILALSADHLAEEDLLRVASSVR